MTGRVVADPSGAALAGALVCVRDDGDLTDPDPVIGVTSDATGHFTTGPVAVDRPLHLVATADGHVPRDVPLAVGAPRDGIEIRLGVGGVLEGEVRDAEGRPASGWVVTILEPEEPLPPRRAGHRWYVFEGEIARVRSLLGKATCDSLGHFEIRGVPLGKAVTATVHPTDRLEARSLPATFSTAGERLRRDVQVPRPGSLLVRFAHRVPPTKPPQVNLEAATIWFTAEEHDRLEDGSCLFEALTPGSYEVKVFPHGAPMEQRHAEVRAGERAEVVIGSPSGTVLEGKVVDEEGLPVARAHVWWEGERVVMGDTGDDGGFRLEGIADSVGTLTVSPIAGWVSRRTGELVATTREGVVPGNAPLRIVLRRSPVVTGRILGLAAGAQLHGIVLSKAVSAGSSVTLAEDGRFELFTGEVDARAMLVFARGGFAPLVVDLPPLATAERRDVGDLRFEKGRTIAGVVRDDVGAPVAGATVIVAERWTDAERQTTVDGTYRFEHMPDRATEVRVNAAGFPVHIVTLPPGSAGEQAAIVLDRGGVLQIRVIDAQGTPIPGAHVTFTPDGDPPYDADHDKTSRSRDAGPDGRLEARLQARGHRVVASDPASRRKGEAESVVVRAGETTAIEITVR